MNRVLRTLALTTLLGMVVSGPVRAATTTTAEILSVTAAGALACLAWQPVGVCFWLRCGFWGCEVETSVKVGHYAPELVVSVYNEVGNNPWVEMAATSGAAAQTAASGVLGALGAPFVEGGVNRAEKWRKLTYREGDAIGHPMIAASWMLGATGIVCPTIGALPFFPHYTSGVDALAWRFDVPELFYLASVVPGLREVGRFPFWTWGNVHPRTGWIAGQVDEMKAAAVIAQRVGDITTRTGQPHLYVPTLSGGATSTGGMRVWFPPELRERDPSGKWQMVKPVPEPVCKVFGTNDLLSVSSAGGGKIDLQGDYVWNLWRPYQCCEQRGTFLFSVDVVSFP